MPSAAKIGTAKIEAQPRRCTCGVIVAMCCALLVIGGLVALMAYGANEAQAHHLGLEERVAKLEQAMDKQPASPTAEIQQQRQILGQFADVKRQVESVKAALGRLQADGGGAAGRLQAGGGGDAAAVTSTAKPRKKSAETHHGKRKKCKTDKD